MTESKRRKQIIREGHAAFREAVDAWMPKPKVLKIDRLSEAEALLQRAVDSRIDDRWLAEVRTFLKARERKRDP